MRAIETNFDGLVGPTHNYSGLSFGNIASAKNQGLIANPKLAALQGLKKMKALADMGYTQGVLPPQERPCIFTLRALGYTGDDAAVILAAVNDAPLVYSGALSASSMWAANAATVSPSADTADGRVHFTPANLNNKFHRSIEHPQTSRTLRAFGLLSRNGQSSCHAWNTPVLFRYSAKHDSCHRYRRGGRATAGYRVVGLPP